MDTLEKVELIREKCDVSYEEARNALEVAGGDVLDAIIELERQGKARPQSASYSTSSKTEGATTVSVEMAQAQADYEQSSRRSRFGQRAERVGDYLRHVLRRSVEITFIVNRYDDRVITVPFLVALLLIVLFPPTLPLMVIGLFFGFRYHIDGASSVTIDVNDVMDKAAGAADSIKKDVMSDE